jgi:hypothetical protein
VSPRPDASGIGAMQIICIARSPYHVRMCGHGVMKGGEIRISLPVTLSVRSACKKRTRCKPPSPPPPPTQPSPTQLENFRLIQSNTCFQSLYHNFLHSHRIQARRHGKACVGSSATWTGKESFTFLFLVSFAAYTKLFFVKAICDCHFFRCQLIPT